MGHKRSHEGKWSGGDSHQKTRRVWGWGPLGPPSRKSKRFDFDCGRKPYARRKAELSKRGFTDGCRGIISTSAITTAAPDLPGHHETTLLLLGLVDHNTFSTIRKGLLKFTEFDMHNLKFHQFSTF